MKHYLSFLFFFFIILLFLLSYYFFYFSLGYNFISPLSYYDFSLSFYLDLNFLVYTFMVMLVCLIVLLYSEFYLEHYSCLKFMMIFFIFLISMFMLSSSSSIVLMFFSWDLLGVSSVLMITFYPSFNCSFNSMATLCFNRIGDLSLFVFFLFSISDYFVFPLNSFYMYCNFLILLCILSKSAQFPLSFWLPLAMSAPTPVSAMVHSSTLVTSGLFILFKISDAIFSSYLAYLFILFSSISFFIGGLMATLETDFKKTVAFSTLSQISMIFIFLLFGFKFLSYSHMIFHSVFKSTLFVMAGLTFSNFFFDQFSYKITLKNLNLGVNFIFMICIFSMMGLTYSISFYSKDYLLEWVYSSFNLFSPFLLLLIGSLFTITYCCKIYLCGSMFFNYSKFFNLKSYPLFFFYFCMIMFLSPLSLALFSPSLSCFIQLHESLILFFLFSSFIIFLDNMLSYSLLLLLFLGKFYSTIMFFTFTSFWKPFSFFFINRLNYSFFLYTPLIII